MGDVDRCRKKEPDFFAWRVRLIRRYSRTRYTYRCIQMIREMLDASKQAKGQGKIRMFISGKPGRVSSGNVIARLGHLWQRHSFSFIPLPPYAVRRRSCVLQLRAWVQYQRGFGMWTALPSRVAQPRWRRSFVSHSTRIATLSPPAKNSPMDLWRTHGYVCSPARGSNPRPRDRTRLKVTCSTN